MHIYNNETEALRHIVRVVTTNTKRPSHFTSYLNKKTYTLNDGRKLKLVVEPTNRDKFIAEMFGRKETVIRNFMNRGIRGGVFPKVGMEIRIVQDTIYVMQLVSGESLCDTLA